MVNTDRIVPITKIDYLSMIGTAMKLASTSFSVLAASDVEGTFTVTGDTVPEVFISKGEGNMDLFFVYNLTNSVVLDMLADFVKENNIKR